MKFSTIYLYTKSHDQAKYLFSRKLLESIDGIKLLIFTEHDTVIRPDEALPNSIFIFDDISGIMKTKSKLGMGLRKRASLKTIIGAAKKSMNRKSRDARIAIKTALKGSKEAIKKCGGKKNVKIPRILPLPIKIGGALPLIPIFAGLSALRSIAGRVSGIIRAINEARNKKNSILGKGLYLKHYTNGSGLKIQKEKKIQKSKKQKSKKQRNEKKRKIFFLISPKDP